MALHDSTSVSEALNFETEQHYEDSREEKKRQQVRDSSPDIRELRSKIQMAKINKAREHELAKKEEEKEAKKLENAAIRETMNKIQQEEREQQLAMAKKIQEIKIAYRNDLENQVEQKKKQLEEFKNEKLAAKVESDNLLMQYEEEKLRMLQAQVKKQNEWKKDMDEFRSRKTEWTLTEQAKHEEQDRKNMEVLQSRFDHEKEIRNKIKEREKSLTRMNEKLSERIKKELKDRDEKEKKSMDTYKEECNSKEILKEREMIEKKQNEKIQLQNDLKSLMKDKKERQEADKMESKKYHEMIMKKDAEEREIASKKAEIERVKKENYGSYIQQMIEKKKTEVENEKVKVAEVSKEFQEREEQRQILIDEERKKIIEEAGDLQEHFPKGTLCYKSDCEILHKKSNE